MDMADDVKAESVGTTVFTSVADVVGAGPVSMADDAEAGPDNVTVIVRVANDADVSTR